MNDEASITQAAACFWQRREQLPADARANIDAILENSPVDPRSASAEQVWRVLWNKPLHANTRVATGERWTEQLCPHMQGAWRVWGKDPVQFRISRVGKGRGQDAFAIEGAQAITVRNATNAPIHRLYAIQNAAGWLRSTAEGSDPKAPLAWLCETPLVTLVTTLRNGLGWGWGPITVLHALADFGLAVKPDLHVMRSMRALGLWHKAHDQPSLREALAVNHDIRRMLFGTGEIDPVQLRRADIELMALSRYGVWTQAPQ